MDQYGLRLLDLPGDAIAQSVLARYAQALDLADHDRLGALFAKEASYSVTVDGVRAYGPLRGRDAVIQHFIEASRTQTGRRRHVVSNCVVDAFQTDVFRVVAYLVVIAVEEAVVELRTTGTYEVELRVNDQRVEIVKMDISLDKQF